MPFTSGRLRGKLRIDPKEQVFPKGRFTPDGLQVVLAQYDSPRDPPKRFDLWDIGASELCPTDPTIENIVFSRDGGEMIVVHKETGKGQFPISTWFGSARIPGVWSQPAKAAAESGGIGPDIKSFVFIDETSDGGLPPALVIGDLTTGLTKQRRVLLPNTEPYDGDPPSLSPAGKFVVLRMWQPSDAHGGWGGDLDCWGTFVLAVDRFSARPQSLPSAPLFSSNDQWLLARDDEEPGATLYETGSMTRRGELWVAGDAAVKVPKINFPAPDWFRKNTEKSVFAPDNKTIVLRAIIRTRQPNPVLVVLNKLLGSTAPPTQAVECARLWDLETCTELACFDDCIQTLYSPDGKTLATAHDDGKVRLWDVPPRKPVLAILLMSLVLWLSGILAIRLLVRGINGALGKLLGRLLPSRQTSNNTPD